MRTYVDKQCGLLDSSVRDARMPLYLPTLTIVPPGTTPPDGGVCCSTRAQLLPTCRPATHTNSPDLSLSQEDALHQRATKGLQAAAP